MLIVEFVELPSKCVSALISNLGCQFKLVCRSDCFHTLVKEMMYYILLIRTMMNFTFTFWCMIYHSYYQKKFITDLKSGELYILFKNQSDLFSSLARPICFLFPLHDVPGLIISVFSRAYSAFCSFGISKTLTLARCTSDPL